MKRSNVIVVGGPIASGKSTLVGSLDFVPIQELDPNDELQKILLKKMYEGDKTAAQIFQLDIMLNRFDKYKKLANNDKTHVFDRFILEDKLFAHMLLGKNEIVWEYYESIWNDKMNEIVDEIGTPKLYILLTFDWKTFKERLFARNRQPEIENFEKNENYFKSILEIYDSFMTDMFKKYDIPYVVVDVRDKNKIEVNEHVNKILKERNFI